MLGSALTGMLVGIVAAVGPIFPDFLRRWNHAASGGTGETALWGEPVFYMVLFGVPAALVGAALGALVGWIISTVAGR